MEPSISNTRFDIINESSGQRLCPGLALGCPSENIKLSPALRTSSSLQPELSVNTPNLGLVVLSPKPELGCREWHFINHSSPEDLRPAFYYHSWAARRASQPSVFSSLTIAQATLLINHPLVTLQIPVFNISFCSQEPEGGTGEGTWEGPFLPPAKKSDAKESNP